MSTVREGPHWVYDACDQGHDYQEEGEDIWWVSGMNWWPV